MSLQELTRLLSKDYRGPKAGFGEPQVLKALVVIGQSGSIGRGRLGLVLHLGQGEVRTMIRRLKDKGLITIEAEGCSLTPAGQKKFEALSKVLPWSGPVDPDKLALGKECFAIIIRGRSAKVRKGIEQRDAAVKAGASGALTVFYRKSRFKVPFEADDCEARGPSEPWITIRKTGVPKEGDTIIISGAGGVLAAEYGAIAAALTII